MELYNALRLALDAGADRLHMPGHKGVLPAPLDQAAPWDFTEIPGTDSLYEAGGCLRALEERFAALYGARRTLLSAGGSTLCIQTMLALLPPGSNIVCDRNLHTSALSAMGLLGLTPIWLPGGRDEWGLPLPPTPDAARVALRRHPAAAVYITSPNYYGRLADVAGLARAAHEAGAALLVDNAHGAHLPFFDLHPLALGADACCDSLHKTLPALTGAALLHLGSDRLDGGQAKTCMSWFGSTSPSYLILLSADLLLETLAPDELQKTARRLGPLRERAGFSGADVEPLRLTVPQRGRGMDEAGMRALLTECGIEPELCNALAAVLLCAPQTDFARLASFVDRLPPGRAGERAGPLPLPRAAMTVRAAMRAPRERVSLENAAGRVAASMVARCPPGVPVVMCGEELDEDIIFLLRNTGISAVDVVK